MRRPVRRHLNGTRNPQGTAPAVPFLFVHFKLKSHKQTERSREGFETVNLKMVPTTGLEPVRCYSLEPESSASANSATRAAGAKSENRFRSMKRKVSQCFCAAQVRNSDRAWAFYPRCRIVSWSGTLSADAILSPGFLRAVFQCWHGCQRLFRLDATGELWHHLPLRAALSLFLESLVSSGLHLCSDGMDRVRRGCSGESLGCGAKCGRAAGIVPNPF